MAKQSVRYACTNCGAQYSSWAGKCSQCGEWNTIQEEVQLVDANTSASSRPIVVHTIKESINKPEERMATGLKDIDDVLGGGIVKGGVTLVAGQPGIGKSTLLLQLANAVAQKEAVLYVSGEESAHQIGMRANRMKTHAEQLSIATSNSANEVANAIATKKYQFVVVDSIQTMQAQGLSSPPGSVTQITNSTHLLLQAAKQSNTALVIVGHVTKEGSIAGPKLLEHIVDVVLTFDGEAYGGLKLLRAAKNRFGPTTESAILEMTQKGLEIVTNPSQSLLEERQATDGSVVLAALEGTRPVLVEVQALVNKTSFGYAKRAASGYDQGRLQLLVAMLERRTKLQLSDHDIYVNIVGGLKIQDPAADLAICMAIGSAAKGLQLNQNAVVFGEVGLSGEVRHVPFIEKRIAEAEKLGFDIAIGPKLRTKGRQSAFLHPVTDVRTALNEFLKK